MIGFSVAYLVHEICNSIAVESGGSPEKFGEVIGDLAEVVRLTCLIVGVGKFIVAPSKV